MSKIVDGYFPPPWDPNKFPEKTEGWISFQNAMKKDPLYYQIKETNKEEYKSGMQDD